jgi:CheY-like chemotaxis protein
MTSRILLADDSITIQKVVNLTFADEGIEVIAVSNGEQAERRLSEISPDLVLADIFMPGKNGYELCEFVKQSPQFRNVPVVLLVGAFEPFNEAEARRVRADAHLTKPFESRTLVDTVRKLISMSGRPSTGSLAAPSSRSQQEAPVAQPTAEPSVALPSFNLDLAGMTPDWETTQPAAQQQNTFVDVADPTPLNNASPLELDYGAFGSSAAVPTGFQMEVEEPASNAGFSFASSVKDTAELPPLEPEQQAAVEGRSWAQTEPLEVQPAFADIERTPETADTFGAPFEAPDAIQGFKVRSTFGDSAKDSVLDFDKQDAPESSVPDNVVSFDVDFSAASASDAAADWDTPAEEPTPAPSEPSPTAEVSEPFGEMQFGIVQESAPQALSVDDPLGDVLSVDPSQMQAVEHGVNGGMPAFSPEPTEHFGSLATQERDPVEEATPVSQFPFDSESSGSANERLGAVIHSGLSFEAFSPVLEEPAPVAEERSAWESGSNDILSELIEPATAAPVEVDNAFTAPEVWAVPETEFAAIDIDAVAVDEPGSHTAFGESPDAETGFAFASVAAEPVAETIPEPAHEIVPEPVAEVAASAPPEPAQPEAAPMAQGSDGIHLSQALIDEIVRRVVAEMGDAVVREIAWEVVPDCVERVVEKLSHEASAKRM